MSNLEGSEARSYNTASMHRACPGEFQDKCQGRVTRQSVTEAFGDQPSDHPKLGSHGRPALPKALYSFLAPPPPLAKP